MDLKIPEKNILQKVENQILLEDAAEKEIKRIESEKAELMSEYSEKIILQKIISREIEEEAEKNKDWLINRVPNVFSAMENLTKEMLSTADIEEPSTSFSGFGKEIRVDDVASFFYTDRRFLTSGTFMIPLSSCDWDDDEGPVSIDLFSVLKFNLLRGTHRNGFPGFGWTRIFTSNIWNAQEKSRKYMRRLTFHKNSEAKKERFQKFLELKAEFGDAT